MVLNGAMTEVSVVVAMYNAAETLPQQLAALARQRVDVAWELLLCDNGSSDESVAIAHRWISTIPHLRIVDASARRGPAAARNVGVMEARGRWVLFCDADDVVADDWIGAHLRALTRGPLCVGEGEFETLRAPGSPMLSWLGPGPVTFTMPMLPGVIAGGAGNMGVEREVFLAAGAFEERLRTAEDADLCWRLQLAGYPLVLSDALVHIRSRSTYRSIAHQAYIYGGVYKTLWRRYSMHRSPAAAHRPTRDDRTEPGAFEGAVSGLARVVQLVRRVFRRRSLADATWGVVHRLGQRFGPEIAGVGVVELDGSVRT